MGKAQDKLRAAVAKAMQKARKKQAAKAVTDPAKPPSIPGRLHSFIADPIALGVFGALAGVVGMVFYTPILLVCGALLYLSLYRSGALRGLAPKHCAVCYVAMSVIVWPSLYFLSLAVQKRTSNDANLLPGVSSAFSTIIQKLDWQVKCRLPPTSRKTTFHSPLRAICRSCSDRPRVEI